MPTISTYAGALLEPTWVSGTLVLVPANSQGQALLDAMFAADGALTTVAITQVDAGRGGYADASSPQKAVQLALSA